ncbi:hypothetical protein HNR60_001053 [Rhodopseudomonas rhenobacensis]|uniref:Uncharacterized protein n=1 Tax=Rhodopseudomonas rhenobacensis TaxID=87461 RepID=A0A7W8DXW3_9BRAD|nr:hypothetical protein [Rhodopseudomonas rhenobacensis]MBB5046308.1 hypothetical protein [Rhodopseudomonas rhenobacensis]
MPLRIAALSLVGFLRAGAALAALLSASALSAEDIKYEHYIADTNQVPIVAYFGDLGAFATLVNRGQRAADSYRLPAYDIDPRREACFPGFPGNPRLPQNYPTPNLTRVIDLAGRFAADLPAGTAAEITGNVKLVQRFSGTLKTVTMEALQPADVAKYFSKDFCPFLRSTIEQHRSDADRLLIGDVYYVDGDFKIDYELTITGSLSANALTDLSKLLAKIGLKNVSLGASVSGSMQQLNTVSYTMRPDVAAAMRPYYLDADDLKIVTEKYLKTGVATSLKTFVNDETRLRSYLADFPDLRQRLQTDPWAAIASSKDLVEFDAGNETHRDYVAFQAAVSNSRRILGLPFVEPKRRT